MKYKNVFWGVILIIIGTLFILKNLDVVYFTWASLLRLWPVLLILWGISIIPTKNTVKLLLSLVVVALAISLMVNNRYQWRWDFRIGDNWRYEYHDDKYYRDYGEWETQQIYEPYDNDIESVYLKFDAAIGEFSIEQTTTHLMEFQKEGNLGPYEYATQQKGDKLLLELDLEKHLFRGSNFKNEAFIKLNTEPNWDLDIDVGAAEIDLDLSPFKIRKLDIDGGASSIDIRIGDLLDDTELNIDAGASSITIFVPEESGCELDVSSFLTSRDFEGFEKIEGGLYRTENYRESNSKVMITVDAAITSFTVRRY